MTATDPPTGGDAVRRRMTAPLPGTAAPAAQGPGSEAGATIYSPGVIPDGAERRSGTSGGLAPAARGRGLPPNRERRSTTGRLHARNGYSI